MAVSVFADVDDLQTRWKPLSPSEIGRANALLNDAAIFLRAEFERNDKKINEEDELLMSALKIVSCAMVKRMMNAAQVDGVSQMGMTAGPFNQQFTLSNPSGDMYLTAREYGILGISQRRSDIAQIGPITAVDHADG